MSPGEERVGQGGTEDRCGELEQTGPGDEQDSKQEKLLGVADLLGEKEKKASGNKDDRKEIRSQAEQKEEDAAKVSTGGSHQVGFGVLRWLGVEGKITWVEGKKGKKEENPRAEDGQGDDLLAEAGSGAGRFWFSHGKGCV